MSSPISTAGWGDFVENRLLPEWLAAYRTMTRWSPEVLEIELGELHYLFDRSRNDDPQGDDRLVVVWGRSAKPGGERDAARMRGFLPGTAWLKRGRDRGHLVAHSAGGGPDLNLVPQLASLNRGLSPAGRRWRKLERYAAKHPGTPLFVRPLYESAGWEPSAIDYGLVRDDRLDVERFSNSD